MLDAPLLILSGFFVVACVGTYLLGRAHGIGVGLRDARAEAESQWQQMNQWIGDLEERLSILETERAETEDEEDWR